MSVPLSASSLAGSSHRPVVRPSPYAIENSGNNPTPKLINEPRGLSSPSVVAQLEVVAAGRLITQRQLALRKAHTQVLAPKARERFLAHTWGFSCLKCSRGHTHPRASLGPPLPRFFESYARVAGPPPQASKYPPPPPPPAPTPRLPAPPLTIRRAKRKTSTAAAAPSYSS
jgi:hypothetical protein